MTGVDRLEKKMSTLRELHTDGSFAEGFTIGKLAALVDLNGERLQTWYRRGQLDFGPMPGRGRHRLYQLDEARFLLMLRVLTDAGIPVSEAVPIAKDRSFVVAQQILFGPLGDQTPVEALRSDMPGLLAVIVKRPGRGFALESPDDRSELGIRRLLRGGDEADAVEHAIILDYITPALKFYKRLDVLRKVGVFRATAKA